MKAVKKNHAQILGGGSFLCIAVNAVNAAMLRTVLTFPLWQSLCFGELFADLSACPYPYHPYGFRIPTAKTFKRLAGVLRQ